MLFKDYSLMHNGIETGILINGKTVDNYHPSDVRKLMKHLPPIVKLMMESNFKDSIMGDSEYEFDEDRRLFHYQPDFTELRKSIKKKNPLYIYSLLKKDGSIEIPKHLSHFKDGEILEHHVDCPACHKVGIIGTEYCGVCWGAKYIKVKSVIHVVPCDAKTFRELKKHNYKKLQSVEDERAGYPDWTSIKSIKSGSALSWDDLDDMC